MTVALITGLNINGRIPHANSWVDVTPHTLYFETLDEAHAVADSIEVEHHARGTHPVQIACKALDDPLQHPVVSDELRAAHRAEHRDLDARMGA